MAPAKLGRRRVSAPQLEFRNELRPLVALVVVAPVAEHTAHDAGRVVMVEHEASAHAALAGLLPRQQGEHREPPRLSRHSGEVARGPVRPFGDPGRHRDSDGFVDQM